MPTTKEVDENRSPSKVLFTYGVDAVEVVRCKDCKWWNSNEETCIENGGLWRASDFCSWAERKENEVG